MTYKINSKVGMVYVIVLSYRTRRVFGWFFNNTKLSLFCAYAFLLNVKISIKIPYKRINQPSML